MATIVVTPENWDDPSFWQGVSTSNQDTLDLSQLGEGFSFEFDAADQLSISDGETSFSIGRPNDATTDANLGSGTVGHFDNVIAPTSAEGNAYTFYGDRQDVTMSDGDDDIDVRGGDDTVSAGGGDDTVNAGSGHDVVFGGSGDDVLIGGTGDDTLSGGDGADDISGGSGRDFVIDVGVGDTIDGGEGGIDADTLDLSGSVSPGGSLRIIQDPDNPENGDVEYYDADGLLEGRLTYSNIETIVPCFCAGTHIRTLEGDRAVETLRPGDLVLTRDNGWQTLRWIGQRRLNARELQARPGLAPIAIAPGALGPNQPASALHVSPQHRLLIRSHQTALTSEQGEMLVAALHLLHDPQVTRRPCDAVTYVHLLFDRHEIVLSNGAWTESFQPAERSVAGFDDAQRAEIKLLFPDLFEGDIATPMFGARPSLKRYEAALISL
ncbi:Hint domain-containing protein [Roseobacteraceae bacterium S113]